MICCALWLWCSVAWGMRGGHGGAGGCAQWLWCVLWLVGPCHLDHLDQHDVVWRHVHTLLRDQLIPMQTLVWGGGGSPAGARRVSWRRALRCTRSSRGRWRGRSRSLPSSSGSTWCLTKGAFQAGTRVWGCPVGVSPLPEGGVPASRYPVYILLGRGLDNPVSSTHPGRE